MRIAIIDLLFSWPPHGGADVDVYHVTRELRALNHDARVFFAREENSWERGQADPESLPFPAERLEFPANGLSSAAVTSRFLDIIHSFNPEAVLLTQGYFLKVPIIHALSGYTLVSRCYAHELACHRDILRFRGEPHVPWPIVRTLTCAVPVPWPTWGRRFGENLRRPGPGNTLRPKRGLHDFTAVLPRQ